MQRNSVGYQELLDHFGPDEAERIYRQIATGYGFGVSENRPDLNLTGLPDEKRAEIETLLGGLPVNEPPKVEKERMSKDAKTNGRQAAQPSEIDGEQTIREWEAIYEVPLTCPSGARVVVTPPTLSVFIRAGRPPLGLAQLFSTDDPEAVLYEMPLDEAQSSVLYSQRMCEGVMVKPRAAAPNADGTMRPLQKGEMDARRMPNTDLFYIAGWAATYNTSSELSRVRRAEVTRADAENFRQDTGLSTDGVDGAGVQTEGVEPAEDQRSGAGA